MAVDMNKLVNLDRLKEFQTSENASTASEFSTSKSYAAGAYVYYKGKLYKFKSAHAAGAWTTTDVEEAKLADDVSSLKESISNINEEIKTTSTLQPTINNYNNAGSGTLSVDTLSFASGVLATPASRIGKAIQFKDEAFIGKKFIFKPHFVITGDKSVFVATVSKQANNDMNFTVLNNDPENIEILLDFTNATLINVSLYYFYVIVNGNGSTTSNATSLSYTGYDLQEYIGESVSTLLKNMDEYSDQLEIIEQRLDGTEVEMSTPTFVANSPSGVVVDSTNKSASASTAVTAGFYLGFRYNGAGLVKNDEILYIEFDVATTGTTVWNPYIYPETSTQFNVIFATLKDGKAKFLFKIKDASINYMVFALRTNTFYQGDTITLNNESAYDLSLPHYIASAGINYYKGKELTCFGDSYTMMGYWQPTVCAELGMNEFTDAWGQSGGTLTSIYQQINTINTDADVVTVWIGTNDYAGNRTVGELNDTVETIVGEYPTFAGALNYVCDWLAKNMAGKTVVFITPTYRHDITDDTFETNNGKNAEGYIKNNAGFVLADYADIMVAVANKWGYPCLDLFHYSGINEYTYSAYYNSDRLHPSRSGAVMLGHKIAMFILQQ